MILFDQEAIDDRALRVVAEHAVQARDLAAHRRCSDDEQHLRADRREPDLARELGERQPDAARRARLRALARVPLAVLEAALGLGDAVGREPPTPPSNAATSISCGRAVALLGLSRPLFHASAIASAARAEITSRSASRCSRADVYGESRVSIAGRGAGSGPSASGGRVGQLDARGLRDRLDHRGVAGGGVVARPRVRRRAVRAGRFGVRLLDRRLRSAAAREQPADDEVEDVLDPAVVAGEHEVTTVLVDRERAHGDRWRDGREHDAVAQVDAAELAVGADREREALLFGDLPLHDARDVDGVHRASAAAQRNCAA